MVVKATAHLFIAAVKQVAKVCAVYDRTTDADSPPPSIDSTLLRHRTLLGFGGGTCAGSGG